MRREHPSQQGYEPFRFQDTEPVSPSTAKSRIVLAVLLGLLALVAYWPSPVDQPVQGALTAAFHFLHRHGVPAWINYKVLEASANVALFVPMGLVSSLSFPKMPWWLVGAFGFIISGCMELGQLVFLHDRLASLQDVVMNTTGTVMGAALAAVVLKKLRARHLAATGPQAKTTP